MSMKPLLAGLILAGLVAPVPAGATSVIRAPDRQSIDARPALVQPVRWERACHREMVRGRDAYGRRVMVPQRVCGRVWVRGPR